MDAGYSREWLDKTDLTIVLDTLYIIREKKLKEIAKDWLTNTLQRIDMDAARTTGDAKGEKEPAAIEADRVKLEIKHFGQTLDEFIETKGMKSNGQTVKKAKYGPNNRST